METAEAFAPGHITGIFEICDNPVDPLFKGSRGAGVSLKKGVKTRVTIEKSSRSSIEIRINGRKSSSTKVSKAVALDFNSKFSEGITMKVFHSIDIPIGAGFGSSGAAALSLALALNKALNFGLDFNEVAQVAHRAEIKCQTGLGTVIAEAYGGVEIRTSPGAPGIGTILNIPLSDDYLVISLIFGSLSTKKALSNPILRTKINNEGRRLINKLIRNPTLENFLGSSRKFAELTGLITSNIRMVMEDNDLNVMTSMPMFGEAVFTVINREDSGLVLKIFKKYCNGGCIITSEIDFQGARLL